MRIISGKYGGRRLSPPKNITARPTTDFAKESLFNLFNNRMDFEGTDVLDLFAGTGGIGIECISRGAREVTAVEIAHVQQNWIIACCKQLGIRNLSVIRGDVFKFLGACKARYDLIFADPPYDLPQLPQLPELILNSQMVQPGTLVIVEHPKANDFSHLPQFTQQRVYGKVHFSFFEVKDN